MSIPRVLVFALTLLVALVAAPPATAQSCVSDCGCPPGETCRLVDGVAACEQTLCPTLYDPVCGLDGKTYSNACMANVARVGIAREGECGESREDDACCCLPTLLSAEGTVVWSRDPELANAARVGQGHVRVTWTADVSDDVLLVTPRAPHDDFPRSLLAWPARRGATEVDLFTDAHYVDGNGNHDHREYIDVEVSVLRCPRPMGE